MGGITSCACYKPDCPQCNQFYKSAPIYPSTPMQTTVVVNVTMPDDPRDELIEKLVEVLEYSYNFNSPQENGNTVPFDKFAKMEDISKWDFYGLGTAHKVAKALALAKAHGYGGGE